MKTTPRHAYPVSSLPYPKETMRKALKKYMSSLDKQAFDASLERALSLRIIKGLYLSLSDFMPDADAKFVNDAWKTSAFRPSFNSDADQARYEKIVERSEDERESMGKDVDVLIPPFTSINLIAYAG